MTERDKLLIGIGECLHTWSFVELELSNLYTILHGIKRDQFSHPTRAAFEAVISLEARLAMMRAYVAADSAIDEDYLPHIKELTNRVSKLYSKRHEIAHFMLVGRETKRGHRTLIRPYFRVDSFNKNNGPELDLDQIQERSRSFSWMSLRVKRHVQHVGKLRGLSPEYYVQAGDIAFEPLQSKDLARKIQPSPPQPFEV